METFLTIGTIVIGILTICFVVYVTRLALKPIQLPKVKKSDDKELKLYKLIEIFRKTYSTPSWYMLGIFFAFGLGAILCFIGTVPFLPFTAPDKVGKIFFYQFGAQKIVGAALIIIGFSMLFLIAKRLGLELEKQKKAAWNKVVQENAPEIFPELKDAV